MPSSAFREIFFEVTKRPHRNGDAIYRFVYRNNTSNAGVRIHGRSAYPFVAYVEDMGSVRWNQLGTGTFDLAGATPIDPGYNPGPGDVPGTVQVKTYNAQSVASWYGTSPRTETLDVGTFNGVARYSSLLFPAAIQSDLAGKTIEKVELYLENEWTYYGAGMTLRMGRSNSGTLQRIATMTGTADIPWGRYEREYKALPAGWWRATDRQLFLGPSAPGTLQYYGKFRFDPAAARLRVTFR